MDRKHQTIVNWAEPSVLYAAHKRLSSIDLFRAVRDGQVPIEPGMALLGAELTKVEPGEIVMELTPAEQHLDQSGTVQPGILTALADTAAGYAIHTQVPLGVRCATLEMQVNLLEPVTIASGRISVIGRAVRVGQRTATCEAKVLDSAGKLCSLMSATFIVLPPDPAWHRISQGPNMPVEHNRHMSVSWADPALLRGIEKKMPWIDILRGMVAGEMPLPPSFELQGFRPVSAEPGEVVFTLDPAEQHYNLIACVHGGILSALCDTAAGLAVHSRLPFGKTCTTLELHINFIRAVSIASGRATCVGRVIHLGGRTATAEARITDSQGRLCAHMGTTLMVLDIPKD